MEEWELAGIPWVFWLELINNGSSRRTNGRGEREKAEKLFRSAPIATTVCLSYRRLFFREISRKSPGNLLEGQGQGQGAADLLSSRSSEFLRRSLKFSRDISRPCTPCSLASVTNMSSVTHAEFGAQLLTKDGSKSTEEVLKNKRLVGVYFSAHWVSLCCFSAL
jgi:hypothetical protein